MVLLRGLYVVIFCSLFAWSPALSIEYSLIRPLELSLEHKSC